MNENERDEVSAPPLENSEPIESEAETDEPIESEAEPNEAIEEPDDVDADDLNLSPRDPLSIALVVGLAALLLLCVILVFIANRHRPAGL